MLFRRRKVLYHRSLESGRLMAGTFIVQRPLTDPESILQKRWNKTLKELREIIPDYMTEWDYEPPNSRSYAKLGLLDDYQWVFQSRMKSRKEWHEKQELRKQLNEDFEAWGHKHQMDGGRSNHCPLTPASTNYLYFNWYFNKSKTVIIFHSVIIWEVSARIEGLMKGLIDG